MPVPVRQKKSVEVHFIVSTDSTKTDADTRKFIRSHVMLGKNLGRPRPDRRKKKTPQDPKQPSKDANDPKKSQDEEDAKLDEINTRLLLRGSVASYKGRSGLPPRIGGDFTTLEFAASTSPSIICEIIKFAKSSKKILFPLEPVIDFNHKDRQWWDALTVDPAYLNTTAFMAYSYFDLMRGHRYGPMVPEAAFHFIQAVHMLRERLITSDKGLLFSDSTLFLVLSLALHAHTTGDGATARNHMKGLRKIVGMRGGIRTFRHNEKLLMEILRCDLGISLHSGTTPVFFLDHPFLEPLYPYPDHTPYLTTAKLTHPASEKFLENVSPRLAEAWTFLKGFCYVMNSAAESDRRLPQSTLMNAMTSIMYRLISMSFKEESIDEAIRLGLLSFSSYIFLRWQGVTLAYIHLPSVYKSSLVNLNLSDEFPPEMILWLLMVGAIAVFEGEDDVWLKPWLRVNFELCGVNGWEDLKGVLKGLMWVGFAFDKAGEEVYERCTGEEEARFTTVV
ncbi:hypothetical protein TWF225_010666 [Orbilia oligospora]|nr:hypothetical protein TWF751_004521 [Orbilia oligospora]KAF3171198.1 hypothetical protein TWF225_010666 [Orbilia oligospora]KAF3248375.1 hypothetical protein TWF128_008367 [Orbilia oligospora]KAF3256919.1 hypothetical protein TWF217_006232 [Orbilia oligospora]KAF3294034.1 hypothetical protein TWF132_003909 [Orbilia oligospora]